MPVDAPRSWPLAPAPGAPVELEWPQRSYTELVARFPTLTAVDGLQLGEVSVRAFPTTANHTTLYVNAPYLGLGVIEDAWGQFVARDQAGRAVWLNPAGGIRAIYPVLHRPFRDSMELMVYAPVVERLAAAPDGFIPNTGPLLGETADALERYRPWIVHEVTKPGADRIVLMEAPPGEWDIKPSPVGVHISKRTGRVWSFGVSVRLGPGVERNAIHDRISQRWGRPRTFVDGARERVTAWKKAGVDIESFTLMLDDDVQILRIEFEMRKLR